jgi:hypothetical protein
VSSLHLRCPTDNLLTIHLIVRELSSSWRPWRPIHNTNILGNILQSLPLSIWENHVFCWHMEYKWAHAIRKKNLRICLKLKTQCLNPPKNKSGIAEGQLQKVTINRFSTLAKNNIFKDFPRMTSKKKKENNKYKITLQSQKKNKLKMSTIQMQKTIHKLVIWFWVTSRRKYSRKFKLVRFQAMIKIAQFLVKSKTTWMKEILIFSYDHKF